MLKGTQAWENAASRVLSVSSKAAGSAAGWGPQATENAAGRRVANRWRPAG